VPLHPAIHVVSAATAAVPPQDVGCGAANVTILKSVNQKESQTLNHFQNKKHLPLQRHIAGPQCCFSGFQEIP